MSFSLIQILLFIVAYLGGLFAVAYLADRGVIPRRITHHPAVYVLSLGVIAGAMATNGMLELANRYGYSFLLYYLGTVVMFVLATILLLPLLRLCRIYQLSSLADVLTFRFRSPSVGATITVAMCLTLLPLLALQIQVVADSIHILEGGHQHLSQGAHSHNGMALLFCIIIIVFSILFGTRHISSRDRNTGLVAAIAFESLVKLAALMVLFFASIYGVFGGFDGLDQWLVQNPAINNVLDKPMRGEAARGLLLIFFGGAVCMPHIFHMAFAENTDSRDLHASAWGLPLYLLLLSLPILPVTWAWIKLGQTLPVEYAGLTLGLQLNSAWVSGAAFVAGMSAASATLIVATLALANMCVNHLVLPLRTQQIDPHQSIYSQLKWLRQTVIALLIAGGYLLHIITSGTVSLNQLGLVAFIGTLQFLPAVVATLYWRGANRRGLLTGLAAGLGVWFFTLFLPIFINFDPIGLDTLHLGWLADKDRAWATAATLSLTINTVLFALVSLLTRSHPDEIIAADICSMDDLNRPTRQTLSLHSPEQFIEQLATALGDKTAEDEVQRALADLQFRPDESRPYALRRLRHRIEANLSGLLGPAVSYSILNRCIPFQPTRHGDTEDMALIEQSLDKSPLKFTGMAADLDNLRRHYRETLNKLPLGVCSLGIDGELLLWNRAMEQITHIPAAKVLGSSLSTLPQPWRHIIEDFTRADIDFVMKQELQAEADHEKSQWIRLHKAASADDLQGGSRDSVILVEDITHAQLLQEELVHSERLASIGRLAAGVAHEIGNPVTGIACLAQNLEYETDPTEIRNMAQDILTQTDRVSRIVESLVNFSYLGTRSDQTELTASNVADCIDEAIHLLQLDSQARLVQFDNQCDREYVVLADSQRLLQVFINLLSNGRDACDSDGLVTIAAQRERETIIIRVEDNGSGIPQQLLSQVFEPFFTTKDPGQGTGLGLALVYSIMEDMGGSVHLVSPIGSASQPGTRATIQLPSGSYTADFLS